MTYCQQKPRKSLETLDDLSSPSKASRLLSSRQLTLFPFASRHVFLSVFFVLSCVTFSVTDMHLQEKAGDHISHQLASRKRFV